MFGILTPLYLAQITLGGGDATVKDWDAKGLINIAILLVLISVPFLLGKFVSNRLRMPTHSMAFSWILLATIATSIIIGLSPTKYGTPLKFGPEIIGGTNFIYEIDRSTTSGNSKERRVMAKDFLVPLNNRLNPSGTKEMVIRPIGDDQIEITVPAIDANEIAEIKRAISEAGILQFRIVANRNDHADIIQKATAMAEDPDQNIRVDRDVKLVDKATGVERVAGIWRYLGKGIEVDGIRQITGYQTGDLIRDARTGRLLSPPASSKPNDFERWVASQKLGDIDILLALEKAGAAYVEVDGSHLDRAQKSFSNTGGFEVTFRMSISGAGRMLDLTGANQPSFNNDFKRRMAILLDGRVLSAPNLNSPIRSDGVIQGNFSEKEVDFLVQILNAGALPGAIGKEPISQNVIGASMGKDAIAKATWASGVSLVVTIVCVLLYYRFSGIIATIAMLLNLAMILGCMILIKQPLTLSGMAGLVLSVGMSVDANVLVFERIREETQRKATSRMAIRNGFDRAWTTIFDSNITTLISAVVLYWIGTEQIKGFAITLIIGLVISLFTAVYVTHKLFEIAERWKFAWLGMSDYVNTGKRALYGDRDIDFMSSRAICYIGSATLIVIGLVATGLRGSQILDIDFNGGTAIVFSLDKGMEAQEVRTVINKVFDVDDKKLPIQTSLTNVKMQGAESNTVYKLDVSLRNQVEVTTRLLSGFGPNSPVKLVTYDVDVKLASEGSSMRSQPRTEARLVAYQDNPQPPTTPTAEATKVDSAIADAAQEPAANAPQADTSVADKPTDKPAIDDSSEAIATVTVPTQYTSMDLLFKSSVGETSAKMNAAQLSKALTDAAKSAGLTLVDAQIEMLPKSSSGWTKESALGFQEWTAKVPFDAKVTQEVAAKLRENMQTEPVWQSISQVNSRVAGEMQVRAIGGLLVSLVFIVAYIWFRFQRVAFGIAAVIALVHDVLIMLAFIAASHWLFTSLGFLLIEDFKISLTTVAGFLTIIGYSLNDTIVVFDRIREVKGKSPNLTEKMINASVTQTLSRTLLTSSTTIVAILLMYIFGGEGIHGFAFCLFIGIIVGTYSSIFIAAPILLWFVQREQARKLASKVN